MTWQRLHCVECWHDMEHCATCGCHDDMPAMSNLDGRCAVESDSPHKAAAPAGNRGLSPSKASKRDGRT